MTKLSISNRQNKITGKTYAFLIILDAAASYLAVYSCITTPASYVIQHLRTYMYTYQVKPRAVVGDMTFHNPAELVDFYKCHAIKQIPT